MPFLMGALLAVGAEPAVRLGVNKLHIPRPLSAGLGVTLTLLLLAGILSIFGALAVKELGSLGKSLPDVQNTVEQGMTVLQDFMVNLANRMPDRARTVVTGTILEVFDDGSTLLRQVTNRVPGMVGSVLGWIPDGALSIGTGLLSSFMISARLPKLKRWLASRLPESWKEKYLPGLRKTRKTLGSWFKAQGKLVAVTYGIVAAGLLLLQVQYGFLWAILIALVDAIPVLGTGTVLVPWAIVSLLQGQTVRGFGLIAVYVAAMVTRTVLEPKLVGKQLGLDPLVTLLFLYVGYRLWGILGMILAPMLAAAAKSLTAEQK
jgi:sporulation integral membrane protein YtvI